MEQARCSVRMNTTRVLHITVGWASPPGLQPPYLSAHRSRKSHFCRLEPNKSHPKLPTLAAVVEKVPTDRTKFSQRFLPSFDNTISQSKSLRSLLRVFSHLLHFHSLQMASSSTPRHSGQSLFRLCHPGLGIHLLRNFLLVLWRTEQDPVIWETTFSFQFLIVFSMKHSYSTPCPSQIG